MTYSNWGAFVYKNGERQRDRILANLLKLKEQGRLEDCKPWESCQHAVLGSGAIRLCGHKSYPLMFRATEL